MIRNLAVFTCAGILFLGTLSGCGSQEVTIQVNTLIFDAEAFQSIRLDYDADDIHVLKSDNDKVIVKEYMNENKKRYYARTFTKNGALLITEGDRPRRASFKSYIEIYIPQNYTGSLSLHSTSGTIESEIILNLSNDFSVDTTSGAIEVSNVRAFHIKFSSTSGNLRFENIGANTIEIRTTNAKTSIKQASGVISYQSKGGNLTASGISGSGSFNASGEGPIAISFTDVTGNIFAYSKNGTLTVELPSQLAFKFSATTKNGAIDTSFADQLAITDNTAIGTVGASPEIFVKLETRNGDIKASR